MPSPEENSDPACHAEASRRRVISPFSDVHENVRRFNEDEAVWRCYQAKRNERRRRFKLRSRRGEKLLDRLDWLAAEREARPVRAIGTWVNP